MPEQAAPAQKRFFLVEYFAEASRGFRWLRTAPKPEVGVPKRVAAGFRRWSRQPKARLGAVTVVVIMGLSYILFSAQAGSTPLLQGPITPGGGGGPGSNHVTIPYNDTVAEDADKVLSFDATPRTFKTFVIVLTWTDEPGSQLQVNQPDSLGLVITAPNGANYTAGPSTNPQGGQGKVSWSLNDTGKDMGGLNWTVSVKGGNMGDYTRPRGFPCFTCPADTSNRFEMMVDYTW